VRAANLSASRRALCSSAYTIIDGGSNMWSLIVHRPSMSATS